MLVKIKRRRKPRKKSPFTIQTKVEDRSALTIHQIIVDMSALIDPPDPSFFLDGQFTLYHALELKFA